MFNTYMSQTMLFGCLLSVFFFWIAKKISKKFKWTILNPILVTAVFVVLFLGVLDIRITDYERSSALLSKLLTPATISLAVPMYRQLELLKKYAGAVLISIFSGILAGCISILGLAALFVLPDEITLSLMPKSITTVIAMGISEEIGGNPTVTVGIVVFTGILGAIIVKTICKIFAITNPVSVGLACGNAAHAIGTSKALEIGEIEGAMSSLSIVIAGLLTVIIVPIMVTIFI